jgi:hypothetical protein
MASASQTSAGRARHAVRAVVDPERRRAEDCPPYHYWNRMRLTACRSVSCYGGSAGRIALVGRVLEYWPPQADGRASSQAGRFLLKK